MPDRTRNSVTTLIALLALVLAGSGAAVAAGIAKNSVTSKSIKNNAVKSKDLKDGSVTSVDVRDGSLESADVKDGSLETGDVKDEGLTGTDIAEASLDIVPNTKAVNGVRITPVSLSLPSTAGATQVLAEGGNSVSLDCSSFLRFEVSRAASGPPVLLTGIGESGTSMAQSLAPGESVVFQVNDGQFTIGMALLGGASATLEFTAIYEVNAQGTNDCFYRGTLTRSP